MNKTYLLDTHILLWWLANDPKLIKDIDVLIASEENEILVSICNHSGNVITT